MCRILKFTNGSQYRKPCPMGWHVGERGKKGSVSSFLKSLPQFKFSTVGGHYLSSTITFLGCSTQCLGTDVKVSATPGWSMEEYRGRILISLLPRGEVWGFSVACLQQLPLGCNNESRDKNAILAQWPQEEGRLTTQKYVRHHK